MKILGDAFFKGFGDDLTDAAFTAGDRLVNSPLEAVAAHPLVPLHARVVGELSHGHIHAIRVEVYQVLLAQLIEEGTD